MQNNSSENSSINNISPDTLSCKTPQTDIKQATGTRDILSNYLKSINGLRQVEELIVSKLKSEAPALTEISKYLLDLGGKRIRPALCLICAKALGTEVTDTESSLKNTASDKLIQISAGIELIHMATLLHDDIIDKSRVRRHKSSPFVKYGVNDTLLTGDFLLVRAFSLCSKLDQYIISITEDACVELTEGEILEIPLNLKKHDIDSSLLISKKKTAALFRLACECAAHISSSNPEIVKLMSEFGENIGIAFQILDDILDVTASAETLGKEPGADIRERKPSVINILWLNTNSELSARLLKPHEEDTADYIEKALFEIKNSTAVAQAKALAKTYTEKAYTLISEVEKITDKKDPFSFAALRGLVDYCIQRME